MKTKRSPIAFAAAALAAAPPAAFAQPLSLTPAQQREDPAAPTPTQLSPDLSSSPPQQEQQPSSRLSSVPDVSVSASAQADYTRLAFRFAASATVIPLQQGNRLDLRFSRPGDIDLAELRAHPPRFLREVRRVSAAGAPLRLQLTLEGGVRQRHFVDGDRVVVDLLAPPAGYAEQTGGGEAPTPASAPVRGNAQVQVAEEASATLLTVTWPAPTRAAAFRRGEALWIVFDASGRIDLSGVARAGRRHSNMEVVTGEGVVGLRIAAAPDIQASAAADGNSWRITLGARAETADAATLTRESDAAGARLRVDFGREGVVRWVRDPEVGDRIGVALLGGPARGVHARRATVEAAVLPAAHGAVIEPRADDVSASFVDGDLVVTRGQGLIASTPAAATEGATNAAMLEQALSHSEAEAPAPEMALADVRARIDELNRRAANEGVREGAPVTARMDLARFLLRHELAAEALGALRVAAINQGELVEIDPEYRLMRAAANLMLGRTADAQADLSASALVSDPSAALWRGYSAYLRREWSEARRELERGAGALDEHPVAWRALFALALATSALELNDHATAEAAAKAAIAQSSDQHQRLLARFIDARIAAQRNDHQRALTMFDELARTRDEEVAVQASLEAIRLRRATGVMRPIDAVEPLEALRFRWRGDAVEIAIVGILGESYSELGRWRDAMSTMRTAVQRYPGNPAVRQLRADMSTLFERLFLDGEADKLEPIRALGLFYEFSDLTPVGPSGDRIVRLLAGRLVHVDLLEQAAQLLQHQVDERLEGVSKAQVAADLAAIYLMDRKPDRALTALASSRQPNMAVSLLADRRIIEARALMDLGRLDAAVEMVERDRSEDAQRVRADAAWRARDWDRAGAELRSLLAMRDRGQPLDAAGRQAALRAGVALTLAGDETRVRAFYREYAGDFVNTEEADAFEVIAAGVHADGAALRDVARAVARVDLLDRFVQRQRARITEHASNARSSAPAGGPGQPGAPQARPNEQQSPPAA